MNNITCADNCVADFSLVQRALLTFGAGSIRDAIYTDQHEFICSSSFIASVIPGFFIVVRRKHNELASSLLAAMKRTAPDDTGYLADDEGQEHIIQQGLLAG